MPHQAEILLPGVTNTHGEGVDVPCRHVAVAAGAGVGVSVECHWPTASMLMLFFSFLMGIYPPVN